MNVKAVVPQWGVGQSIAIAKTDVLWRFVFEVGSADGRGERCRSGFLVVSKASIVPTLSPKSPASPPQHV